MNLSDTIWKQKEEKQLKHLLNKIHLHISNLGFTPGRIECVIRVDLLKVTLILFLPSQTSTADMSHSDPVIPLLCKSDGGHIHYLGHVL